MDLSEEWGRRIDSGNAEAHEVSFTLVFEGYTEGVAAELDSHVEDLRSPRRP